MSDDEKDTDPLAILDAFQPFVENLRGLVALLMNDGFSDTQARDLVVAAYQAMVKGETA